LLWDHGEFGIGEALVKIALPELGPWHQLTEEGRKLDLGSSKVRIDRRRTRMTLQEKKIVCYAFCTHGYKRTKYLTIWGRMTTMLRKACIEISIAYELGMIHSGCTTYSRTNGSIVHDIELSIPDHL
jgi:hypothetical protein